MARPKDPEARNAVGHIARVANHFYYRYDCQAKADTTTLHLAHKNESTVILNLGLSEMAMVDARALHLAQRLLNLGRNEMTWSLALLASSDLPIRQIGNIYARLRAI